MGSLEPNKIFAAILVAGITASASAFVAEKLVHPNEVAAHGTEEAASGEAAAKPQLPEPILAMIATADVEQGAKLTKACAACHSFDKGGPNGVGPNLWNVTTRGHAATDFAYSEAMASHKGERWSYLELNKFLWKPKQLIPGTKMVFAGIKKPEDRAAVIAWLRQHADSPPALPSAAEIAAEEAELAPPPAAEEAAPAEGATDGAATGEAPAPAAD